MSIGQGNPNIGLTPSSKVSAIFVGDHAAADEGSFFVSTLAATASTAVACTTQALADTNPAIAIFNGHPTTGGGFNVYLRYIKALQTVVGGTNTTKNYSALVDSLLVKLTTIGTAMGAPASTNTGSGVLSKTSLWGGVNITAAQSSAGRRVGDGQVTGAVEVAFDEWIFQFGSPVITSEAAGSTMTLVKRNTIALAPVILAPGWWFTLGFWGASQAAAANTIRWEVGFIERPSGQ